MPKKLLQIRTYIATTDAEFIKIGSFVGSQTNQNSIKCWMLATQGRDVREVQADRKNGKGYILVTEDEYGNIRAVIGLTLSDLLDGSGKLATSWFAMFHDSDIASYDATYLTHLVNYIYFTEAANYRVKKAEILVTSFIFELIVQAIENCNLQYEVVDTMVIPAINLNIARIHVTI